MVKRDRTAEIIQIKARGGNRGSFVSFELNTLWSEWDRLRDSPGSRPDYYLIKAVTILEVFTRTRIAMLVNHGTEYVARAATLVRDLKIDFDLANSIHGRAITLGDIVGHGVPVNAFGQIIEHFKTLLDLDLGDRLAKAVDRWQVEVEGKPSNPIISDYDDMAAHVKRLFEIRHVLCHELPKKPVYEKEEVSDLLLHATAFAKALENVLHFQMYGLTPLTQSEMNIDAANRLHAREQELESLVQSIQAEMSLMDGEFEALQAAQEKWLAYRNAHCDFETLRHEGGTIRPLLWGSEARELTEERLSQLKSWREHRSW
jgi:uncharacterized protein YecT (DUF1311 family)